MKINLKDFFSVLSFCGEKESKKEKTRKSDEDLGELVHDARQEVKKAWNNLIEEIKKKPIEVDVSEYKKTEISLKDVVEASKRHMVSESNEVVAIRKEVEEGKIVLYLGYSKDGQLLPPEKNHYIKITAERMAENLESLFGLDDCIKLK